MTAEDAIRQAEAGWNSVQKILYVPHTRADYERLVELLDAVIELIGDDEKHPFNSLAGVMTVLVEDYEDRNLSDFMEL